MSTEESDFIKMFKSLFQMCLDAGMTTDDMEIYLKTNLKLTPKEYMDGKEESGSMQEFLDSKFGKNEQNKLYENAKSWTD